MRPPRVPAVRRLRQWGAPGAVPPVPKRLPRALSQGRARAGCASAAGFRRSGVARAQYSLYFMLALLLGRAAPEFMHAGMRCGSCSCATYMLDAPTVLAACCWFDFCHKYMWYYNVSRRHTFSIPAGLRRLSLRGAICPSHGDEPKAVAEAAARMLLVGAGVGVSRLAGARPGKGLGRLLDNGAVSRKRRSEAGVGAAAGGEKVSENGTMEAGSGGGASADDGNGGGGEGTGLASVWPCHVCEAAFLQQRALHFHEKLRHPLR